MMNLISKERNLVWTFSIHLYPLVRSVSPHCSLASSEPAYDRLRPQFWSICLLCDRWNLIDQWSVSVLNERSPEWKVTWMKGPLNERSPEWKVTWMKGHLNGRSPEWKVTWMKCPLNEMSPEWKVTWMKGHLIERSPEWKVTWMKGHPNTSLFGLMLDPR